MARRKMARPRYDEYGSRSRSSGGSGKKLIVLAAVIIGAVIAFWYINPTSAPEWARNFLPDIRSSTVYKWTDDDGKVQYTHSAPSNRPYEKMDYWENANIIPANPPPE